VLALLVFAIKFLIRRPRPEGEWGAVYRNTDPHSFPSGHAARAALLALLVVALGPSWFTIVVLLWAPLVCLARVATGLHYLSDVFAGILFGLLAGWGLLVIQPLLMSFFPFLFIPFF
jgi:undecaprenyl-diphosphatase